MPVNGQGDEHVVGGGQGVGLEKLEHLAEDQTSQPLSVQYLPDQLTCRLVLNIHVHCPIDKSSLSFDPCNTCHGEESDQQVCQHDVEVDGLAPPLAQATLA